MFSSHLNTWIKVASMHKGRWRHKMVALQGQVGTCYGSKAEMVRGAKGEGYEAPKR